MNQLVAISNKYKEGSEKWIVKFWADNEHLEAGAKVMCCLQRGIPYMKLLNVAIKHKLGLKREAKEADMVDMNQMEPLAYSQQKNREHCWNQAKIEYFEINSNLFKFKQAQYDEFMNKRYEELCKQCRITPW